LHLKPELKKRFGISNVKNSKEDFLKINTVIYKSDDEINRYNLEYDQVIICRDTMALNFGILLSHFKLSWRLVRVMTLIT